MNPKEAELVYDATPSCEIWGIEFNETVQKTLDHDHEAERIRGVLCGNCNLAIGLFNEDVVLIASAIDYLDRNRAIPRF